MTGTPSTNQPANANSPNSGDSVTRTSALSAGYSVTTASATTGTARTTPGQATQPTSQVAPEMVPVYCNGSRTLAIRTVGGYRCLRCSQPIRVAW